MNVQEILKEKNRDIITVNPKVSLIEAMQLLITNKISCLPVVKADNELIGIISDKDIFKAIHDDIDNLEMKTVGDLMSTDLIVGIASDDINFIAGLMTNNKIRHIPIVKENIITGLISIGDIVKAQMTKMEIENRYLKNFISGGYPG